MSIDGADLVLLSGCSGGGKSTLLAELQRRGEAVIEEPGRRVIAAERATGGTALPWLDLAGFAHAALAMAIADIVAARASGRRTVFDRGVIDAAAALDHLDGGTRVATIGRAYRYNHRVFLTPPWQAIFATDAERRHDFEAAVAEHRRLLHAYRRLGYDIVVLPRIDVSARADFVLARLAGATDRAPPR